MDLGFRVLDVALALVGALGGWVLNSVRASVRDLQAADRDLADKVAKVEVLVAGDYVRKDEMASTMAEVKGMLRRIEDKLDRKVDRDS